MTSRRLARIVRRGFRILREMGPSWILKRFWLRALNKSGWLRWRTPMTPWARIGLPSVLRNGIPASPEAYRQWRLVHAPAFFIDPLLSQHRERIGARAVAGAERLRGGEFPFFGQWRLCGMPPRWLVSDRCAAQAGLHWTRIHLFAGTDIKHEWELSRGGWAYQLARAYMRTGDERHAELFWTLFEHWMESNPPNRGVNWICGQETTFRAMAFCFAYAVFVHAPSTTPERAARIAVAMHVHGERIDAYLGYALSQKNNHGISECVGLITIGTLFPELRHARAWRRLGHRKLRGELRRQVYADGAYVQHSMNYHRVLLQDIEWAIRVTESAGSRCAEEVYDALRRSADFLYSFLDSSGQAPNYGSNDGALVLPLSDCPYSDMRPALQSCYALLHRRRLFPPGPWDEEMLWLDGVAALDWPMDAPTRQSTAPQGGYYRLDGPESWLMMRAARYVDRPAHADQLTVDLWWKERNLLLDPGTYSYNGAPPFDDGFASTRYHNTVTVDGASQMRRASRFLWTDWAQARVRRIGLPEGGPEALQAEHNGYRRLGVTHRRTVVRPFGDAWLILDDLLGEGTHACCLHWLVAASDPAPRCQRLSAQGFHVQSWIGGDSVHYDVFASSPADLDLVQAGVRCEDGRPAEDAARGWISRNYDERSPAVSMDIRCCAALPLRFLTLVSPGRALSIHAAEDLREITLDGLRLKLPDGIEP